MTAKTDINKLATQFLEIYSDVSIFQPNTAKRVGYVESLLENQYRQIEELLKKKYSMKYRDSIRKEFEDKYDIKYNAMKKEIIDEIKMQLDRSVK